jgi:predicted transcriptional regulator
MVPSAALAGVLVVTGWKLVSLDHVRHLFARYGLLPALIWAATFVMVVATDLLTGVLVGMALTLLELIPNLRKMRLHIAQRELGPNESEIRLEGAATFIQLPKIAKVLDGAPNNGRLTLDTRGLTSLDHTVAEALGDWLKGKARAGVKVECPVLRLRRPSPRRRRALTPAVRTQPRDEPRSWAPSSRDPHDQGPGTRRRDHRPSPLRLSQPQRRHARRAARPLARTYAALEAVLASSRAERPIKPASPEEIAASVTADAIVSFENGRRYRSLRRHLKQQGLTDDQYRAKWGLPADYPLVARSFSDLRSNAARAQRFGGVAVAAE